MRVFSFSQGVLDKSNVPLFFLSFLILCASYGCRSHHGRAVDCNNNIPNIPVRFSVGFICM
ncbi:hypothetical protein BDW42DRAFT_180812, partial [Aspergillus taichungensis]